MKCLHCGADITQQVALCQIHEAVEHLGKASKARIVNPLMSQLSITVAARFYAQWKSYRKHKTLELSQGANKRFRARFNRYTKAAYEGGAYYVEAALEKQLTEAVRRLPGYLNTRAAEDLESDLDQTSRDQLATIEASGLTPGLLRLAIAKKFTEWAQTRAFTVGTQEISQAFHTGGRDTARAINKERGGRYIQRHWEVEDNPCELCEENFNAGWIGEDEQYPNFPEGPPGHVNCVCSESFRVVGENEEAAI